jgi:hypothetical protein
LRGTSPRGHGFSAGSGVAVGSAGLGVAVGAAASVSGVAVGASVLPHAAASAPAAAIVERCKNSRRVSFDMTDFLLCVKPSNILKLF